MSGKLSHTEACPRCRSNGNDNRGDNLVVYHDGGFHCFACGYHKYPNSFNLFHSNRVNHGEKDLLPRDYTTDVPTAGWRWLLQYGLPFSYWRESVGYSPSEQRLIFKVGEPHAFSIGRYLLPDAAPELLRETVGGLLLGTQRGNGMLAPASNSAHKESVHLLQAGSGVQQNSNNQLAGGTGERSVGNSRPQRPPSKWKVWGNSHQRNCPVNSHLDETIAVVEDLLSAHKVGQVTCALPLFGTKIHPCHLEFLRNGRSRVCLWLDKDQQGLVQKQASWLSLMINRPITICITDKDPKELNYETIKRTLGLH